MSDPINPPISITTGIDVVKTDRIRLMFQRWGDRFIHRFFTPAETAQCRNRPERMAALIAAKEACSKALGTGLRGVGWREMEILHAPTGKPGLHLHRRALARSQSLAWTSVSLSLTHDAGVTIAVVVALSQEHQP